MGQISKNAISEINRIKNETNEKFKSILNQYKVQIETIQYIRWIAITIVILFLVTIVSFDLGRIYKAIFKHKKALFIPSKPTDNSIRLRMIHMKSALIEQRMIKVLTNKNLKNNNKH